MVTKILLQIESAELTQWKVTPEEFRRQVRGQVEQWATVCTRGPRPAVTAIAEEEAEPVAIRQGGGQ